jgi:Beta protein
MNRTRTRPVLFASACGLDRHRADLVLDAGVVDSAIAVRGAARVMRSFLRDLGHVDDWRSITVTAGAFPVDLSAYDSWVIGERPRYDADMWVRILNRKVPRLADYGDYAISHPMLVADASSAPYPQLSYTAGEHWLILKGRRNHPHGRYQFYRVCEAIASHQEFAGAGLGAADRRIANPREHDPGDATTWRQIGATHHLDFVARRLIHLGEP